VTALSAGRLEVDGRSAALILGVAILLGVVVGPIAILVHLADQLARAAGAPV
jgi:hypothetical protein